MEIVKIRTRKGRIITLKVIKRTETHILGNDKYDKAIILPISEIDSLLPVETEGS